MINDKEKMTDWKSGWEELTPRSDKNNKDLVEDIRDEINRLHKLLKGKSRSEKIEYLLTHRLKWIMKVVLKVSLYVVVAISSIRIIFRLIGGFVL